MAALRQLFEAGFSPRGRLSLERRRPPALKGINGWILTRPWKGRSFTVASAALRNAGSSKKRDEIEGGKIAIGNRRGVAIEKENRIVTLNDNPVVD
jgi:hypothetical protein